MMVQVRSMWVKHIRPTKITIHLQTRLDRFLIIFHYQMNYLLRLCLLARTLKKRILCFNYVIDV